MKNIIFDLDLTLIDTNIAEMARSRQDWTTVYNMIPDFRLYNGMDYVFQIIRNHQINTCIVSTAPRPYIERVISAFDIPCCHIVGYHDARPVKPAPAPMLKALQLLNARPEDTISFGDRVIDIQSSNAADIESVACFWGTKEKAELLRSGYNHAIISPKEIITLIR